MAENRDDLTVAGYNMYMRYNVLVMWCLYKIFPDAELNDEYKSARKENSTRAKRNDVYSLFGISKATYNRITNGVSGYGHRKIAERMRKKFGIDTKYFTKLDELEEYKAKRKIVLNRKKEKEIQRQIEIEIEKKNKEHTERDINESEQKRITDDVEKKYEKYNDKYLEKEYEEWAVKEFNNRLLIEKIDYVNGKGHIDVTQDFLEEFIQRYEGDIQHNASDTKTSDNVSEEEKKLEEKRKLLEEKKKLLEEKKKFYETPIWQGLSREEIRKNLEHTIIKTVIEPKKNYHGSLMMACKVLREGGSCDAENLVEYKIRHLMKALDDIKVKDWMEYLDYIIKIGNEDILNTCEEILGRNYHLVCDLNRTQKALNTGWEKCWNNNEKSMN